MNGHLSVVEVLMAAGADVMKHNNAGQTAVDMAKTAELKSRLAAAAS